MHRNVILLEPMDKKKQGGETTHKSTTTHKCVLNSLQLLSLSLIVAKEVSILTGVDVFMNLQQEPLAEFKCLWRVYIKYIQ